MLLVEENTRFAPELAMRVPRQVHVNRHWREARAYQAAGLFHDIASACHVIEVALARLLYLMVRARGYKRLGYVSFKSYVRQGLRQNGLRRFEYLVAIQRAIDGSPDRPPMEEMGMQWRRGRMTLSQAKQMIAETREGDAPPEAHLEDDEPWERRQFLATLAQDTAWQVAIETCRRVEGADLPVARCVDDLLAEFSSSVPLDASVPAFLPEDERDEAHRAARSMREAADLLEEIHRYAEDVRLRVDPLEGLPQDMTDAADLDRRIRWLLRLEGNVAWHRCRLLDVMAKLKLHKKLGYRSLAAYAREALDCSAASLGFQLSLARRLEGLRRVAEAFRGGLITALEAAEICKVAIPTTQADWIARARTCTLASLQDDVAWLLSQGMEGGLPPQRPSSPPAGFAWEPASPPVSRPNIQRCAVRVSPVARIPMAGRAEAWYQALSEDAEELLGQLMSPEGAKKKVSFSAPVSVCRTWDVALARIRGLVDTTLLDGQCVAVILADFLQVWGQKSTRGSVLVRDGWRCQAPGCTRRSQLHAHHIIYRSHGGPDDRWNLVTVCLKHHAMIHAGLIRVRGRADDALTWDMGREGYVNGVRVWGDPHWSAAGPMPAVQSQINWVRQRS